jgi:hypothetical protein
MFHLIARNYTHPHPHSRTPGRVISPKQRPLPDNTRNSQQTSMLPEGFEHTILASERRGHWDRSGAPLLRSLHFHCGLKRVGLEDGQSRVCNERFLSGSQHISASDAVDLRLSFGLSLSQYYENEYLHRHVLSTSAWNTSAPTGRICIKFYFSVLFANQSGKLNFELKI